MGLPKKALRESQLRIDKVGPVLKDGSHEMCRVTFIEGGIEKSAFYKKLDPKNHYPELLAKISVAISFFKRIFQGENSAEERLVFDDEDRLVGTLSLTIDGFKSFNFAEEPVPSDLSAKERVIPSTKTLLIKNIIKVLFGRWFLDDDDTHPHNLGFANSESPPEFGFAGSESVDIDFDMFMYWFSILMKKPRPVIGVPKKRIDLTVRDWESFPNVKDSKTYHWPTYRLPGQETLPVVVPGQEQLLKEILPKAYADPTQFEQLAHEPIAHEQKFVAAMSALLTYQPEMVRRRLTDLFGDMTLNYTSLDDTDVELRILYEKEFPHLCNDQTNVMSFVDFMMNMYQKHYDNLYRVVVFYMGCDNNGYGVSLASTCSTLYHKPSIYRAIEAWVKSQNQTLYNKDDISLKYDLAELQRRYHQVWRDAYAPTVKELLLKAYKLTNMVLDEASSSHPELQVIEGKKITDESLTNAWEFFGAIPELSMKDLEPLISVDKESRLRESLTLLVEFTNQFRIVVKTYYEKERKDLTEEDNLVFAEQLSQLHFNYNLKIRRSLAHTSTPANEFNLIASKLRQVAEQTNFQIHLTTDDDQILDSSQISAVKEILPHTNEDVIKQYNDSLFLWAKSLRPEELSQYITEIIDTKYAPTVESLSTRHRAQPVKEFLSASLNQSGDNRLAYILSSGSGDTGALNTLLIQHLTPHMLQSYPLPSIRKAMRDGTFNTDIAVFTKAAVNFAKFENRFTHLCNTEGMKLFYSTLFDWIDTLPAAQFKGIVQSALKEYEANLSSFSGVLWGSGSRRVEVEGYCKTSGQAKAVAMTFLKGQDSSSLNSILFDKLILAMKTDISKRADLQGLLGCKLITQFNSIEHKSSYFASLKDYSVAPSHRRKEEVSRMAMTDFS